MLTGEGLRFLLCIFAGIPGFSILSRNLDIINETHLHDYHYFNKPVADRYYCYPGILDKEHDDAAGRADKAKRGRCYEDGRR